MDKPKAALPVDLVDTSLPSAALAETNTQVSPGSALGMAEPANEEISLPEFRGIPLPRIAKALRHHDFRNFWAGNFLSNIGTWMQNIAQGWLVLRLTNSPFWLGVVGFAASAPMLIFTLPGGAIADNVNKRKLILITQSAMMVFAFILAALTYLQLVTVHYVVVLAFATGTAMALNTPTYQALVPQLLPREDLANGIALNSAQFNMSRVIGPTLGGFAMAYFGEAGNFLLNGLSFLAVIVALRRIRIPEVVSKSDEPLVERLKQGFRYVFGSPKMRPLVMLISISSFLALPYITFVPFFARDVLHVQEHGLGVLMAFSGLGAFAAAATMAYFGNLRHRERLVVFAGICYFVAIFAFCFSHNFFLSAALQLISGFSTIMMVANLNTLFQHIASDEMRGRAMSIYATAFLGLPPVGGLLAGSLTHYFSAPHTLAAMALVALVAYLIFYVATPQLRQID